jgi:hypothetical protein
VQTDTAFAAQRTASCNGHHADMVVGNQFICFFAGFSPLQGELPDRREGACLSVVKNLYIAKSFGRLFVYE